MARRWAYPQRVVAKPPFARRVKLVNGVKTTLLMIGEQPKDATYYRIKLAGIWKTRLGTTSRLGSTKRLKPSRRDRGLCACMTARVCGASHEI